MFHMLLQEFFLFSLSLSISEGFRRLLLKYLHCQNEPTKKNYLQNSTWLDTYLPYIRLLIVIPTRTEFKHLSNFCIFTIFTWIFPFPLKHGKLFFINSSTDLLWINKCRMISWMGKIRLLSVRHNHNRRQFKESVTWCWLNGENPFVLINLIIIRHWARWKYEKKIRFITEFRHI